MKHRIQKLRKRLAEAIYPGLVPEASQDPTSIAVQVNGKWVACIKLRDIPPETVHNCAVQAMNGIGHEIPEGSKMRFVYVPARLVNIITPTET